MTLVLRQHLRAANKRVYCVILNYHFANGLLIAYGCRLLPAFPPVGAKIRAWINNCKGPSIGAYASRLVREVRERGENLNYFYFCSNKPPGVLVAWTLLRVCSVRLCLYFLKKVPVNRSHAPGLLNINLFNVYILLGYFSYVSSRCSSADYKDGSFRKGHVLTVGCYHTYRKLVRTGTAQSV